MIRRPALSLMLAAVLCAAAPAGRSAFAAEGIPTEVLRVCADGNLLPFSNDRQEGFENRIAKLIADELKVPLAFTWWPQTIGFVRNTLRTRQCDLVMGTAVGEELMQNTNPYYRSTYALVYRKDSGITATTLADPSLQGARIGVVARTPPSAVMLRHGLTNLEPYQLDTDTRAHHPAQQAVEDVAAAHTDAAIVWGPIAGFFAARQSVPLAVVPLKDEPGASPFQYMISMGIRPDEPDWRHWLNDFIVRRQGDIDRILAEYHVPLANPDGSIRAASAKAAATGAGVPEPDGYRMADYRAPTPPALRGAETVGAEEVERLAKAGAVLVDVLPTPPKPEGLAPGSRWVPPPHRSLPGAHWLPNVGYGAPSADQEAYFRTSLEALTAGDRKRPLVVFCQPDCWMSWNAAKRAVALGYQAVKWYPAGTDGWTATGRDLVTVEPEPKVAN
ncbi:quinoprotein dehydrogenase-associated putative ABC transporter substrate-binding protein [Azospirillum sp. BE72]|uniref:quinoprotein dehydrogenase-associated putative ABC transporter substrate-binding protein n=1 Tax=Azospirillum sp. BE72 TaxID=2817776 RepID=UPI0028588475|nr:quinoprotein dehydrogenase-associated putative ABC transporter substrate-binding protein [Azospirillum sp. BE72]MDR6773496.1 quinoprotein dehydrogenase-associated probable ABC transporter substrate-binding protein/PQQ-dependent catabolism-associated CXXCW motif protein [Azospirillum sp. BE72]